jgi:signal transduction histidine kinase
VNRARTAAGRLGAWLRTLWPPTVRLKLALTYGAVFLGADAVLLALTYLLVARTLPEPHPLRFVFVPSWPWAGAGGPFSGGPGIDAFHQFDLATHHFDQQVLDAARLQRSQALGRVLRDFGIALAAVAVGSVGLGWWVADRVLRPLRTITRTARRLSGRDLTQRIGLRGPKDELKELADTIDAMLDRLQHAFDAQRRFVANASHELRTPLAVDRAAIDLALSDPQPTVDGLRRTVATLRDTNTRSTRLIESLLALARSEVGVGEGQPADLAAVVREAWRPLATAARERGLAMALRLESAPVVGDRLLLDRMAGNLLDNAVRHNVPGGTASVTTGVEDGAAVLRVTSDGPALTPETVAGLGVPFRRAATDRTEAGRGVGLGLSIARAVAEAHGGSLTLAARRQGGLAVEVRLPAQ